MTRDEAEQRLLNGQVLYKPDDDWDGKYIVRGLKIYSENYDDECPTEYNSLKNLLDGLEGWILEDLLVK